ncbi:MAG: DUF192 domain-containing protein [Octadecabacter sp.]|nr:DUF192 domain-containing protein [Octadecabacter sp.]
MGKRVVSAVMLCAVGWAGAVAAACSDDTLSVRGTFGSAQFDVILAETPQEQARGLMFVESMPTMQGMLFVYDRPRVVSFWMRNTLIPLDMIFIDGEGVVQNIHDMAQPLDETSISSVAPVQYVLEINGGLADRLGLAVGDEIQHPLLTENAKWPCEAN